MSDDETKKDEIQDETPQDEAAEAAGPVADEDSSSSQAAGEEPSSTPPAAEAAESEAPAEVEGSSDDAPAEEAAEAPAEPNPEDELPWKERLRLQKSRRQPRKANPSDPAERAAERAPGTGTPPAERESNAAKVRQGIVVSSKGDKSITVRIDIARRHRAYEKIVRSSTKLHAHDERNEAGEGDVVRVIETRPLSKTKRWRLVDVVEKAR